MKQLYRIPLFLGELAHFARKHLWGIDLSVLNFFIKSVPVLYLSLVFNFCVKIVCWYLKLTFMFIFCVNILCWYCAKCNFTWDWSRMGLKHNLPKVWQTASLQSLEAITLQIIIIIMQTYHQQHLYESYLKSTSSACQPQKPSKGIWDRAAVIISKHLKGH